MLKTIIATVLIIMFSGCSNLISRPPVQKIELQPIKVSHTEEKSILDHTLDNYIVEDNKKYLYRNSNCLNSHHKCSRGKDCLSYCYKVTGKDITTYYAGYFDSEDGYFQKSNRSLSFVKTIKQVNSTINKNYFLEANSYLKFKKEYNNTLADWVKKFQSINVKTVDTTNTVPEQQLLSISKLNKKQLRLGKKISAIEAYKNTTYLKIFYDNPIAKYKRYKLSYKQTRFENTYDDFPDNLDIKITNVAFDFMPENIVASDKEIRVIVDTKNSGNNVSFTNHTNSFIKINTISVYYGEDIISKEVNLKLPPQSIKTALFSMNSFNQYIDLKSKNQKISVGVAVEYTNLKNAKRDSLLKINKLSQFDF